MIGTAGEVRLLLEIEEAIENPVKFLMQEYDKLNFTIESPHVQALRLLHKKIDREDYDITKIRDDVFLDWEKGTFYD